MDQAATEDREAHGKKPLKPAEPEHEIKQVKVSRTDKDSGYMVRDGKKKEFIYLDYRTVDGRHAIITDTHVTPANVHDLVPTWAVWTGNGSGSTSLSARLVSMPAMRLRRLRRDWKNVTFME